VGAERAVTAKRFSEGLTNESYLAQLGETRQRFADHEAGFRLSPDDVRFFQDFVEKMGGIKALAIVEDWCPDVHRGLPVLAAIARASGMELRVFPRDKNPDLMNLYLNQGKYQSIPVFAFFDRDLNPLGHWIERPLAATRFMEEIAAELAKDNLSEEQMRQERRKRSLPRAETWRQETVKELKALFVKLPPRSH
jgi:hypothetical protein